MGWIKDSIKTMLEDLRSISSTEKDMQNFSRMVGGMFVLIGVLLFLFGGERFAYFFVVGGVLLLLGVLAPHLLRPVQYIWMYSAVVMGWVMTRVVLGVLFYLIVTPLGFCMRMAGKQFLIMQWESKTSSYWTLREARQKQKESYTVQF